MPSTNCTLRLAPLARGVPVVIVPAESVELPPPPLLCAGGSCRVVPYTVTVHGGGAAPEAVQVAASPTGPTLAVTELKARRSACPPPPLGKVVRSMMRNRRRVTLPPVEFNTRRRMV